MKYWLFKSEQSCYSIDDLKRNKKTAWTGTRNFQVRNFMRDDMKPSDRVLFYHSSSEPTGVVGIAEVCSFAHPDVTAQDRKDEHYDPKSSKENPIWMCVDIKFISKFKAPLTLSEMKKESRLAHMRALQQGNRLSVVPVTEEEFKTVLTLRG